MEPVMISGLFDGAQTLLKQKVHVRGWIRTLRLSKSILFIELNDGSCQKNIQVVAQDRELENFDEIAKLNVGSAISVLGEIVMTPQMKQPFELHAAAIDVEGYSAPDFPLQKKRHSLEYLRSMAHLRARTNTFGAVFRVRSACAFAIHSFFNSRGFIYIHTPIIASSDCEGAGEMFRVTTLDPENPPLKSDGGVDYSRDFFKKPAWLTVSGQLEAECMAMALGKVYTFGPTFRAENSNTPRHAAEFWMVEPEMAFADLNDDMKLAGDMIKYVIGYLLEDCPDEIDFFNAHYDNGLRRRLELLTAADFTHITYTEAIEQLSKSGEKFEFPVKWGCDLQTEHERFLTERVFKKPVFVTDYPKDIKAFYMRLNDDGKTVAAMDLLVPGVGEIIGGSQREERYDRLAARIDELGLKKDDYWWYMDLRKYGGTKHAGFGLGFERALMYLTGMTNIRDVIPFPRTPKSAEF